MAMKEEDFDKVIQTNLKGAFLCMKAAIRPMMKARYGRIVNMSSVVALRGNPGQINYCASKARSDRHDQVPWPRRWAPAASPSMRWPPATSPPI